MNGKTSTREMTPEKVEAMHLVDIDPGTGPDPWRKAVRMSELKPAAQAKARIRRRWKNRMPVPEIPGGYGNPIFDQLASKRAVEATEREKRGAKKQGPHRMAGFSKPGRPRTRSTGR
jgi:hypothetical protein